jgi:hypothetical protein
VKWPFGGGHNIDFSGGKKEVADRILSRLVKYQFENRQFFLDYEKASFEGQEYLKAGHNTDCWQCHDFSLDGMLDIIDSRKVFAFGGPYTLMLRISDTCTEFITPIYHRRDWYSPENHQAVSSWRAYFKEITALMGGNETLYITQSYFGKYHHFSRDMNISFSEKVETIKKRNGTSKKGFTDWGKGKYPSYFIDTVSSP